MRGSFSLLKNSNGIIGSTVIGGALKLVSCSAFSTSSGPGGGGGRGRGRGSFAPTNYDFVVGSRHPGETDSNEVLNDSDLSYPPMGHGHGRGKPLPPPSFVPSRDTFVAAGQPSPQQPGLGRGRGGVANQQSEPGNRLAEPGNERESRPKGPIFLRKDETTGESFVAESVDSVRQPIGLGRGSGVANQQSELGNRQAEPGEGESRPKGPIFLRKDETKGESLVAESVDSVRQPIGEKKLPQSIMTVLSGTGRGKPERKPVYDEKPKEENRHLRTRRGADSGTGRGQKDRMESKEIPSEQKKPKLSREEAVKRAVGILSKDSEREGGGGRRRGKGRGRGRGSRHDDDDDENEDEKDDTLFMGDDADGEKFANKLGPAVMAELTEAFEDLSSEVLPDPVMDEYIEAFDTNLKFELDPESLMGDFENNPDIDENPPIALRDALEKMKPFLMAYEGIESHEEWEEAVKETMERVPLMKEIVDHYCGSDRVTAKQQRGELERVAKTLPGSAPDAVTRFTDSAVMSLQSNPGWGFDRKCQFMDKLVDEFAKSYK